MECINQLREGVLADDPLPAAVEPVPPPVTADLKSQISTLKDELADESHTRFNAEMTVQESLEVDKELQQKLESMQLIRKEIKKEKPIGRKGGGKKWPVHVVLLICELLVNGTPPSAVPKNMQSTSAYFIGAEANELPGVDYVRKCRTVIENLNLMFAGMRLGNAPAWHQLFTDGTTRRQIAFQNLVIGIMEGDDFDSVIASSCVYLENESSEKQVEAVKHKVSSCRYSCFSTYHH